MNEFLLAASIWKHSSNQFTFRDKSIPAVESVAGDERSAMELDPLSRLMEQQASLEDEVARRIEEETEHARNAIR